MGGMSSFNENGAAERAGGVAFGVMIVCIAALSVAVLPKPGDAGKHAIVRSITSPLSGRATARLPREGDAPVLEPVDALATMVIASGLRVGIAASEPAVVSPVAGAFDEDGRLWVAEMRTYMPDTNATGEMELKNRVVVLKDSDGDGAFDQSRVFLEGLAMPRGITPCHGGALIIEPPALYFCKDTDGDGRADVKLKLLDGFTGQENPEHAPNSLLYGIDNWYHLSQHDIEFRFDGEKVITRRTPNIGQWGIAQDAWGRTYTTPNSDPLLIDLAPKHYGARNTSKGSVAFLGRSIVSDKSVHPIHPTPGVNRGYQPRVLRDDNRLATVTAACGPSIYDADALGDGMRGSAFVCEPAGNVVKRYVFELRDSVPAGRNPYAEAEWLASTDERFRPVNTVVGPDGAVYVLDMYRGIIQHKMFLTPYLREQIEARGLQLPTDRGRIYRVASPGTTSMTAPALSRASNEELVQHLEHRDQWWRLTAQRLLVERRATDVVPLVRELMNRQSASEVSRLHAVWVLEGLGAVEHADVVLATEDQSPMVRAAGVRVAETLPRSAALTTLVHERAGDDDKWVRLQAACTLGEMRTAEGFDALVKMIKHHGGDRMMRDAMVSGVGGRELSMMRALAGDEEWCRGKMAAAVLDDLADCMLRASDGDRDAVVELTAGLASDDHPSAEGLLARIRASQRLDSDKPRPIMLSRAPLRWIGAMGERFNSLGGRMAESEVYFDWPDRPPVRRVQGTSPLTTIELARFNRGRMVYAQACVSCHQADGRGSSGQAPPLVASPIAEGSVDRLASVLIHGLEGTWKIGSMTYEAAMPPAAVVGDDDLAAVMTFIRRSFGNAADPVSAEDVAAARAAHRMRGKPWTRTEIEALSPK